MKFWKWFKRNDKSIITEDMIEMIHNSILGENDVLIVKVDLGNLPKHVAENYMKNIKEVVGKVVDCKTIVVPASVSFEILKVNIDKEIKGE